MKIVLQGTPPSLNRFAGRMNSWEYREEKERWTRAVRVKCLAARGQNRAGRAFDAQAGKLSSRSQNAVQGAQSACGRHTGACAAGGQFAAHQPPPFARVRIDYYFADSRRRDPDNYSGKFLLDGLTKAGIIADDDFRHIALEVRGHVDRQNPRTEIAVETMETGYESSK